MSSRNNRNEKMEIKVGERIGPYEIKEEIGKGSFAIVYRAENLVSFSHL